MFNKFYVLSNSDFTYLVNETLANFGYEQITKDNYKEIAASIWDYFIEDNKNICGFMVVNSYGNWEEVSNQDSLESLIYREYRETIEEN